MGAFPGTPERTHRRSYGFGDEQAQLSPSSFSSEVERTVE